MTGSRFAARTFTCTAVLAGAIVCFGAQAATLKTERLEIAGHAFTVEVATTQAQWAHGLMFRTHMAADHGMLFVFPDSEPRYFWMKNTLIPLDMLFFDANRRLINIAADVPPCKVANCPTYNSRAPARYVLELNGGVAKKLGINPGDFLTIGQ